MRARTITLILILVAIFVSGCVQNPAPETSPSPTPTDNPEAPFAPFTVPEPTFDFATVVTPDHGAHNAPALHAVGHGLELVGHTGIGSILPPGMRGSITQIDVWNQYAVVPGMEQGPAFVIVDLTDPAAPQPVSYAPTIADGWTARFSKDGNYVFYGCQNVAGGNPSSTAVGDCSDPAAPHAPGAPASGISVWNVSDKRNPAFVDFVAASGSHNLQTQMINGTHYVFTRTTEIIRFNEGNQTLEILATVDGTHDATVVQHPLTGDWLLYTGRGELAIYNVNDPANPEEVLAAGSFHFEGSGWHDQVAFPYPVDGRVLLALAGETGTNTGGGVPDYVTIVNITDPAHPEELGTWRPAFTGMVPWNSYTFSVHEMAATPQGQLAISWYHGGVWVIDVSTQERQAAPVTVAAYQPNMAVNIVPSTFQQTPLPMVPFVWSVAWDARGYLAVPDMHTGVYVLKPSWGLLPLIDSGA